MTELPKNADSDKKSENRGEPYMSRLSYSLPEIFPKIRRTFDLDSEAAVGGGKESAGQGRVAYSEETISVNGSPVLVRVVKDENGNPVYFARGEDGRGVRVYPDENGSGVSLGGNVAPGAVGAGATPFRDLFKSLDRNAQGSKAFPRRRPTKQTTNSPASFVRG